MSPSPKGGSEKGDRIILCYIGLVCNIFVSLSLSIYIYIIVWYTPEVLLRRGRRPRERRGAAAGHIGVCVYIYI